MKLEKRKHCPMCPDNIDKPLSEFYRHWGTKEGRGTYCKEHQKERSRKGRFNTEEPISTKEVRRILRDNHIPCTTGKAAGFPWTDLAAWGIVPIEAKIATEQSNSYFQWGFTPRQRKQGFKGLLILIAKYKDRNEKIFILPGDEKWLIKNPNGSSKSALSVYIDSQHGNSYLWDHLRPYENAYKLIEDERINRSSQL